jgi:hypothetical protein
MHKAAGDPSTAELVVVLAEDFERLERRMMASAKRGHVNAADEAQARSLIRALFALVEGLVYAIKIDALFVPRSVGSPYRLPTPP